MGFENEQMLEEFDKRQPSYNSLEKYFFSNDKLRNGIKNKSIYCNCDNPYNSMLFKFLCLNFNKLGITKLITTCKSEDGSNAFKYEVVKQPPVLFINKCNFNVDYMLKYKFLLSENLSGDGDFNSEECVIQSWRCDVIISKPPCNKYNEYFGIVAKSEKFYWLITPFEKITEFNVFRNIKHNKAKIDDCLNLSYVSYNKDDNSEIEFSNIYAITNINLSNRPFLFKEDETQNGESLKERRNSLQNRINKNNRFNILKISKNSLTISKLKQKIQFIYEAKQRSLKKKESNNNAEEKQKKQEQIKSKFTKLDNYDAIVIDDFNSIPKEYEGVIAVPLEFLKIYNPTEFEILGLTKKDLNKEEFLRFDINNENVMPIINGVEDNKMRVFIAKRRHYASKDLDWYRDNFFKKYNEDELVKQFNDFINQEHDLSDISDKGKSYNKIINQFLEEVIYSARKSKVKYSPMDSLYNDALLTKIVNYIESKPRFFNDTNSVINLKRFYSGACKIAPKVANFSPNTACKIYERLCPKQNANIYDYSCGFGARMLGCIGSKYNYNYFGTDPNEKLCVQLNKMGEWIKAHSDKPNSYKVYCQGSEYFIEELEGKIDLAFSSPPYFDLEVYTDDDRQCENKHKDNYPAWIEFYVKPTVQNIKRYLKKDGVFALNIKNGTYGGYEHLLDDWTKCAEDEGFEIVDELTMKHQSARIALSNYMVKKYGEGYALKSGTEPVRVFKLKQIPEKPETSQPKEPEIRVQKQLSLF